MQPHSARWAYRNYMAAMTKAAKAFQVFRETVLNELGVSAALNDSLHSSHILHSAYALNPNSSATAKLSPDHTVTYFNHFFWVILPETF